MPKSDSGTKTNEKIFPLLEGAIQKTYEFQGWKIRAAFLELDGPAVVVEYRKTTGTMRDFEVEAILKAEGEWTPTPFVDPLVQNTAQNQAAAAMMAGMVGNKMWKRADGSVARYYNGQYIRLELPTARIYLEKLKQQKEQKARASVPQF